MLKKYFGFLSLCFSLYFVVGASLIDQETKAKIQNLENKVQGIESQLSEILKLQRQQSQQTNEMIEREGRLRGEILSRQQRLIEKIDEGARPPIEIIAEPSSLLEPPAIAEPQPTVVPVQAGGKPDSIDRWGTAALVFSGMTLLGVVLILLVSLSDQKRITAEIQSLSTLLQARPVPRPKRRARKRPAKPIEDRAATRPQLKVRNLMES